MKILSLDASSTAIGWAVEEDGKINYSGTLQAGQNDGIDERLETLKIKLSAIITHYFEGDTHVDEATGHTKKGKPIIKRRYLKKAIMEQGMVYRSGSGSLALGGAIYLFRNLLFRLGIPVEMVNVSKWKRAYTGTAAAKKEQVMALVQAEGYVVDSQDQADAIAMLRGYGAMEEDDA